MNWLVNKMRAGSYALNRKTVEIRLGQLAVLNRANAVVAGMETIQRFRAEYPEEGFLLNRAVTSDYSIPPDLAVQFYTNVEEHLKVSVETGAQMLASARGDIKDSLLRGFDEQEMGIRLLMVALARIADSSFKQTTKEIRDLLQDARSELPNAISSLAFKHKLADGVYQTSWSPNYKDLEVSSDLFLLNVTWTW